MTDQQVERVAQAMWRSVNKDDLDPKKGTFMTEGNKLKMRLAEYYTTEEAEMWVCSPHPQLEGQRPIDLMDRGEHAAVSEILDRLDSCGYI